jgi:N-acetylglucosamine-6-phosphate deacetylase
MCYTGFKNVKGKVNMHVIINGKIVLFDQIIENGVIVYDKGQICSVGPAGASPLPAGAEILDAQGQIVGPGFVDIHCHAGATYTMDKDPSCAAAHHLRHGTTSLCATLGYNLTFPEVFAGIDRVRAAMASETPGNLIGIHFEGPYVSPNQGTNHAKALPILATDFEEFGRRAQGLIRQWMYPPEQPNSEALEAYFKAHKIVSAIGHTDASPERIKQAAQAGATIVTHMFDAMGCWRGDESVQETGIIQETVADGALLVDSFIYEIICDSQAIHVKPANLQLIYKFIGPDRIALVTDCFCRDYNPADYPKEHKRSAPDLNFTEDGALFGSTLSMDRAFCNFRHFTGSGLVETFRMAASTPAKAVHIFDRVGSIAPGKDANFVLMDPTHCAVQHVILRGELVC